MDRIVLHVDMDAFYAAVEERDRPAIRGRPVVVGADPLGGRGRGVVATANYPARRFGIHSAMPISRAYFLCPEAVFLRPSFPRYQEASQEVMEVLAGYADVLEVVGMDEAYLDVTARLSGRPGRAASLARSLQAAVRRKTGLSCSVGVAPNKAVAKIASDRQKPHGLTIVLPDQVVPFLAPLSVRKIHGCGPKTASRLQDLGLHTIADLQGAPPAVLAALGSHGEWIHAVSQGDDPRPVVGQRGPAKSRGRERTYAKDEADMARVVRDAQTSVARIMEGGPPFATVTVKLRYHDFTTLTRAHTHSIPLDPADDQAVGLARHTVAALLAPLLDGRPVRLVGVRASGFCDGVRHPTLRRFGVELGPPLEAASLASASRPS